MTRASPVRFVEFGFIALTTIEAWDGTLTAPGLTMVVTELGSAALDFGRGPKWLLPNEIAMFWSGLPNRMVEFEPGTIIHGVHAPVAEILSWAVPHGAITRAFAGEFFAVGVPEEQARVDCARFRRWAVELGVLITGPHAGAPGDVDPSSRYVCKLEMEARFRRLLTELEQTPPCEGPPSSSTVAGVAAAMRFVAERFRDPITISDVAAAVNWNRHHLMASFRRMCGITLWEYVLRVRVAEARRLLETTDHPISDISRRSGFGSLSRMYDAFRQFGATSPADYRRGASSTREA